MFDACECEPDDLPKSQALPVWVRTFVCLRAKKRGDKTVYWARLVLDCADDLLLGQESSARVLPTQDQAQLAVLRKTIRLDHANSSSDWTGAVGPGGLARRRETSKLASVLNAGRTMRGRAFFSLGCLRRISGSLVTSFPPTPFGVR